MSPVDQIHFGSNLDGDERVAGDCWRACIASILDLPAEQVPHFVQEHGGFFHTETVRWLAARGLKGAFTYDVRPEHGHVVAMGRSPRGDWSHAVVALVTAPGEWDMVHDPHPSRDFLRGRVEEFFVIEGDPR